MVSVWIRLLKSPSGTNWILYLMSKIRRLSTCIFIKYAYYGNRLRSVIVTHSLRKNKNNFNNKLPRTYFDRIIISQSLSFHLLTVPVDWRLDMFHSEKKIICLTLNSKCFSAPTGINVIFVTSALSQRLWNCRRRTAAGRHKSFSYPRNISIKNLVVPLILNSFRF
jgi:hypothetical protein